MTKFKPILVGILEAANGVRCTIVQIKRGGTCRITDQNENHSYAGSIPKAWCNARYQCRINMRDHHSDGVVWARDLK